MSWWHHVSCALGQRFPNYNGSQAAEQECVDYGAMTGFCLARDQKKPVEFQVDSSKAPNADCKICSCAWPANRYDAEMTYFLSTFPSHFAGSPGVFTMGQLAGEVALTALGGCSAAICAGSMELQGSGFWSSCGSDVASSSIRCLPSVIVLVLRRMHTKK